MRPRSQVSNADGRVWFLAQACARHAAHKFAQCNNEVFDVDQRRELRSSGWIMRCVPGLQHIVTSRPSSSDGLFFSSCQMQAMPDPRKWKYEDQLRLLFAAAFGAVLGFTTDYFPEDLWFNMLCALIGAVLVGGAFYCYRAFR